MTRKTPAADTPQSAHATHNTLGGDGNGGRTVNAQELGILLAGLAGEIANAVDLIEDDIGDGHGSSRLNGAVALLRSCGAMTDRLVLALDYCPHDTQDGWLIAPGWVESLRRIEGGQQ